MKLTILTTDSRENYRTYGEERPSFGTAPSALLEGFEAMPDLQVDIVSCVQRRVGGAGQIGENIFYHPLLVPNIGWMKSGYLGCITAVRRKLAQIAPDIVHGQGTERDCAISAVFSGYPAVLTIHGNMRLIAELKRAPFLSYHGLAARLEAFTVPRAAGVICISRYTEGAVKPLARQTWLVPNAVDSRFFDAVAQPHGRLRVICIGNVDARKNQVALIRALDPIAAEIPFDLVFYGGLSRSDAYCNQFSELVEQRDWCRYAGFLGREELVAAFEQASCLVLPSLEDNYPMVLLEAMAAGVPIVAARVGGVPEMIDDGVSGVLFEPDSSEDIRRALVHVLRDPGKRSLFAANARAVVRARNHPKKIATDHLRIYQEVLNKSG